MGLLAVLCFSFTLPATRVSVPDLGSIVIGLGRAIIAGVLAALVLAVRREPFPRHHVAGLILSGAGVVVAFPLFSAIALRSVPAIHGAVIVGLLPISTAIFGCLRAGERPGTGFWLSAIVGALASVAFAIVEGVGAPQPADAFLILAVLSAGFGYAEGARVARAIGGWRVICWALVMMAPFLIAPVLYNIRSTGGLHAHAVAWIGFAYVSVFSMFLGFFAWYAALARGGIARIGQLQLLQLPLTICLSALLLHEQITASVFLAALFVVSSAGLTQRFRVRAK